MASKVEMEVKTENLLRQMLIDVSNLLRAFELLNLAKRLVQS